MKKDAVNPVKWLRFAVATLSLAAMIGLFACPTVACVRHFGWLPRIQFLPAVAAGSVLALVGIAVSVALCGRLYCSVVCPLGIAQDVVRLCFGRIVPRKAGFTRFAHLKEDISIFNEKTYKPMTAAEHAAYAEAIKLEVGNGEGVPCSGCKYCVPCKYGVDIPQIFYFWNSTIKWSRLPSPTDPAIRPITSRAFGFSTSTTRLIRCGRRTAALAAGVA